MVHALMVLFAPVAWPIAKLLDWVLGHDAGHTYKKAELKSFLQFHREGEEPLRDDEVRLDCDLADCRSTFSTVYSLSTSAAFRRL